MDKKLIAIRDLCKTIPNLGKKQLQKMMYLLQRHGLNLGLRYAIHFYGPYCAQLDYSLHEYESEGALMINTSGMTHCISMTNEIPEMQFDGNDLEVENRVFEMYASRSPLELEAITTIDYVAHIMLKESASKEEVIEKVMKIKGTKFRREYLIAEYDNLSRNGLIESTPVGV